MWTLWCVHSSPTYIMHPRQLTTSYFTLQFSVTNDQMVSLKHSKSVPYGLCSDGRTREPRADPTKAVYRGKTPLKPSDIIYVEQTPGVLDMFHTQMSQDVSFHPPARAHFGTRADLQDKFPDFPQPPVPIRSASRTTSLNSKLRPQLPIQNSATGGQHITGRERPIQWSPSVGCVSHATPTAHSSIPQKQQRREATVGQALADVLKTADGHTPAERVRAKSSTARSYTPTPAPPVPTTHSPRPIILRSTPSSRPHLHHSHRDYRDFLKEQDPDVIRKMINTYPVAPLCSERTPAHLRPIRFDMDDPHQMKPFGYFVRVAMTNGCPLDARADGSYRRIINAVDPNRHHSEDWH
ncbi:hypothetical protein DEU56DRAFT_819808 [Suillus clintonianus]|uniref:uncharacterized protein n=1 Tax=Suillus clintonianus TaxID=1904413 RepID=UPI001B85C2DC|nr:uncharacterized protein DEU56DRAFT_819808 [Suillus clintonianus]KAG2127989.1 hypothetical protein DEU56DRAFT_819808 [Suillus clintonianus]